MSIAPSLFTLDILGSIMTCHGHRLSTHLASVASCKHIGALSYAFSDFVFLGLCLNFLRTCIYRQASVME